MIIVFGKLSLLSTYPDSSPSWSQQLDQETVSREMMLWFFHIYLYHPEPQLLLLPLSSNESSTLRCRSQNNLKISLKLGCVIFLDPIIFTRLRPQKFYIPKLIFYFFFPSFLKKSVFIHHIMKRRSRSFIFSSLTSEIHNQEYMKNSLKYHTGYY